MTLFASILVVSLVLLTTATLSVPVAALCRTKCRVCNTLFLTMMALAAATLPAPIQHAWSLLMLSSEAESNIGIQDACGPFTVLPLNEFEVRSNRYRDQQVPFAVERVNRVCFVPEGNTELCVSRLQEPGRKNSLMPEVFHGFNVWCISKAEFNTITGDWATVRSTVNRDMTYASAFMLVGTAIFVSIANMLM